VAKWAKEGVIEQSCCDAISSVVNHESEWCNLSGHHVCLLGATSAMGPITTLLRLGATVYAVDIDRPAVWKKLFAMTEASPGTLVYPLKSKPRSGSHADLAEVAGCNLMEQPAEITTWLAGAAEAHAAGAEVSPFCACMGSPCRRHRVHGASIARDRDVRLPRRRAAREALAGRRRRHGGGLRALLRAGGSGVPLHTGESAPPMHQTDLSSLVLCCSWGSPVTRPSSMPEPRHAL
jgi:hypothetical protein